MDRIQTILRNGGDGSRYLEDRRVVSLKVTHFSLTIDMIDTDLDQDRSPDVIDYEYNSIETIKKVKCKSAYESRHLFDTRCEDVDCIALDQDRSLNVIDYEYHFGTSFQEVKYKSAYKSRHFFVFLGFKLYPSKPLYCRTHDSINCRAEWTCLVSVVDSEGRLRYPQSLTMIYDGVEEPEIPRWIEVVSADSLLEEAEVLLPDDTLTIQVDMVLKQNYPGERCKHKHIVFDELLNKSFEIKSSNGECSCSYPPPEIENQQVTEEVNALSHCYI